MAGKQALKDDPFLGEDPDELLIKLDRSDCKESLVNFVKLAWHMVEPGAPYAHGWHIDFLAYHLESITFGETLENGDLYNRLLINIPPGTMKSLLVNVFWPAWEWGPCNMPHMRYICASHSQELAIRDGLRMRRLVESEWYKARWPHVEISRDQNQKQKFENTTLGFRQCAAAGSITGARADRVIIDDPLSVQDSMSQQIKDSTNTWFLEAVPTRLVSPERSAIIVIMQRLAEDDVSGVILNKDLGFDHICLPMKFEINRSKPTLLGVEDPRTEEGELLFPDRFPEHVVERDENIMGKWATAGQFQQNPVPRGGGVIQADWWQEYKRSDYPTFSYIIAAVDGAYTVKQENDCSACTVWGVWDGSEAMALPSRSIGPKGEIVWDNERIYQEGKNSVLLLDAWAERLEFHELVERVRETMSDYKVDRLLIENKANGYSIAQEMQRLYGHEDWGVQLIDPKGMDKLSRLYAVQHLFTDGLIYAPNANYAQKVINEVAVFPKGARDDLTDTVSMALTYLRKTGLLIRPIENSARIDREREFSGANPAPLYPV